MGHALSMYVHMCYLHDVEDRECVRAEAQDFPVSCSWMHAQFQSLTM